MDSLDHIADPVSSPPPPVHRQAGPVSGLHSHVHAAPPRTAGRGGLPTVLSGHAAGRPRDDRRARATRPDQSGPSPTPDDPACGYPPTNSPPCNRSKPLRQGITSEAAPDGSAIIGPYREYQSDQTVAIAPARPPPLLRALDKERNEKERTQQRKGALNHERASLTGSFHISEAAPQTREQEKWGRLRNVTFRTQTGAPSQRRPQTALQAGAGSQSETLPDGSRRSNRGAPGHARQRESSTSRSSLRVAGTRTTANQPPSTRNSSHAGYSRAAARADARLRRMRPCMAARMCPPDCSSSAAAACTGVPPTGTRRQPLPGLGARRLVGRRPADDRPPELDLRQSERLRCAGQRKRQHARLRRHVRHRAGGVERIVGEDLVHNECPAPLTTDHHRRSSSAAETNEPVGLFGETTSTARVLGGAAAIAAKSISQRP